MRPPRVEVAKTITRSLSMKAFGCFETRDCTLRFRVEVKHFPTVIE